MNVDSIKLEGEEAPSVVVTIVKDTDKYRQYAELKAELEALEDEVKVLGIQLKGDMEKEGMQKCFLPGFGTFSVMMTPRYTYSEMVNEIENDLKEQKERERNDGTATAQATSSLRFTKEKN